MPREVIEDVLAQRYASAAMLAIWSERGKIRQERLLWLAVLRAQQELGLPLPSGAIEAYEAVVDDIDLAAIATRERKLRHDVKARIEVFCEAAGHQLIHRGMTSRDLTDNVEQLQVRASLLLARDRLVAILARLACKALDNNTQVQVGRSHNVAAQVTTLGKRLANAGQEVLVAYQRIEQLLTSYPLRGIKGPMGTAQDQLDLLDGDLGKLAQLEAAVGQHLGFSHTLNAVGQVYPRSLDHEVVSALKQAVSGFASLATTFRQMAGFELFSEGLTDDQVSSSAMPHKDNTRTCERICGLNKVLLGYEMMVGQLGGDQWQEGDVSCSVVRRVALPGACFAFDGAVESLLTVLDEFVIYPAMIDRELERYFPLLTTTRLLSALTKRGLGRETAHAAIRKHAIAAVRAMRQQGADNDLFERLAADPAIGFNSKQIRDMIGEPIGFIGDAQGQVRRFVETVQPIVRLHPDAAGYQPAAIL